MLLNLKGVHGTYLANVDDIKKDGFNGHSGRLGEGAYFWKESDHAYGLAKAWVRFKSGSLSDFLGTVLFCRIAVDDKNLFNIEDDFLKELILIVAKRHNLNLENDDDVSAAHEMFIVRHAKKTKTQIDVIQGRVASPPKKWYESSELYSLKVLGPPTCYAVRRNDIIEIEDISTSFKRLQKN